MRKSYTWSTTFFKQIFTCRNSALGSLTSCFSTDSGLASCFSVHFSNNHIDNIGVYCCFDVGYIFAFTDYKLCSSGVSKIYYILPYFIQSILLFPLHSGVNWKSGISPLLCPWLYLAADRAERSRSRGRVKSMQTLKEMAVSSKDLFSFRHALSVLYLWS